jgi:hypothetical protein
MDKLLDAYNQQKLNQEDIKHLNSPITCNEIEKLLILPTKKSQVHGAGRVRKRQGTAVSLVCQMALAGGDISKLIDLMHGRCDAWPIGIVISAVVAMSPSTTFMVGSPYNKSHMVNTMDGHWATLLPQS